MAKLPATMPANNLVAVCTLNLNEYTVTFKVNGTTVKTAKVKYTFPVTYPTETEIASYIPEGHAFTGWDKTISEMPANDVTISAETAQDTFTVTYYKKNEFCKNGQSDYTMEEVITTQSYKVGATITPPAKPTEAGFTASDWETK